MTADRLAASLQRVLDQLQDYQRGPAAEEAEELLAEYRDQSPAEGDKAVMQQALETLEAWWSTMNEACSGEPDADYAAAINALRAVIASNVQPKGTAKCNCTAYCGQYLMHGSCPAYPAAVTVVPAPATLTSVCHMECGGCIDAGKCAFPGKPAEPVRYPHPDEDDAVTLWAEIHRLRAAVQGPDGYATWQEAATAERVRRVAAEKALAATQAPAPAHGRWINADDVDRLVRELDVALNGDMAAPQAKLCDLVAEVQRTRRQPLTPEWAYELIGRHASNRLVSAFTQINEARDGTEVCPDVVAFMDAIMRAAGSQAPAVGDEASDWRTYWADEMQKKADKDKERGCLQPVSYYVRSAFIYAGVGRKS